MKKERIDFLKIRRCNNPIVLQSLKERVLAMIHFFNGYEYGDTAVVLTYHDYRAHAHEFTGSGNNLKLAGIPVYFDGIMPHGQILLTTIEAAEKLQNDPESEAC